MERTPVARRHLRYRAYIIARLHTSHPGVFANRPLRSVGEFGYAYNLLDAINNHNGVHYLTDFKDPYDSTTNPDPALLDFFTYNSAPVRSGIVSLNTRQPPVLAAILKGAIYNKNSNDADYHPA